MRHHTEAFIGIDTSKLRNAVAIVEGGRDGEVRFLGELPATEVAMRKFVAKLAAKYGLDPTRTCPKTATPSSD